MFVGLTSIVAMSIAALAHPQMTSSVPAENAMLAAGTTEIRIVFNENLEPSLSGGDVWTKAGKKVEIGKAMTDPKDKKAVGYPNRWPVGRRYVYSRLACRCF